VEIEFVVQSTQDGAVQNVRPPGDRRFVIGRDPESPARLQGPGISREHLAVEPNAGRFFLHDLSSNGTWVNGSKVEKGQPREIREGDLIEIPGYQIDVRIGRAPAVPPPPTAVPPPPAAVPPPQPAPEPSFQTTQKMAIPDIPETPAKPSLLAPVTGAISALSLLEKIMILAAIASFWLGIYYYTS
jgi:type VI secretion system protein ImpI